MIRLLFVCSENSCRSQMAEAFARMYGGDKVEAISVGSSPLGVVNEKAIAAMSELGYDLSTHRSKSVDDIPGVTFEYVVTMGCGDACPSVPARNRIDWDVADPKHMTPEPFNRVRDDIAARVKKLISGL
jgi:protein-tyrosine-phosphatase